MSKVKLDGRKNMKRIALVAFDKRQVDVIRGQISEKGITNVDVFSPDEKVKGYKKVIREVKPNKKDALLLDLAGVVAQHGYPTMKRDFDKVRPERGEASEIDFKDVVCPFCDYSTQFRNCRKEIIETKQHVTRRTYCPNCNEIIKEDVKETKEIERLKLVEDYTNTSKVTDEMVGKFVEKMRKHHNYKPQWTSYMAKAYNKDKAFQEAVKILYNRHEAELINITTATKNLMKLKDTMKL